MSVGITSDAVVFLDNNEVVKEMLYPEFEAILDNVVGIGEFKGRQMPAAYVRINDRLQLTRAVFFLIDFDASGYVDRSWNIPLSHLADSAGNGPDLGAGPIKLACRSQCSVSWHQRALWDPVVESDDNTLAKLARAAKRNRLGLAVNTGPIEGESSESSVLNSASGSGASGAALKKLEKELKERLGKKFQQELKSRTSALVDEQKLRIATLKSETQDHVEKIQVQFRQELERGSQVLESTKQMFSEEKHKNLQLKKTLEKQVDDLREVRERFQQQIEDSRDSGQTQLLALEEKFELEQKAQFHTATAELKEMLDMREVEVFYRDEQIGRLNAEISQLRQEKQSLIDGSGDRVLQKLVDSGITFVAYQPGIDHLTVPVRDMSEYLDSPLNYVAGKSAMDPQLYKQWVAHFELSVCNHRLDDGTVCGEPLMKIEKPSRFIAGESDRCSQHSRAASTLSHLMRVRETS